MHYSIRFSISLKFNINNDLVSYVRDGIYDGSFKHPFNPSMFNQTIVLREN